ncbi:YciI family protein [Maridesulfovibrio salexigens]|uniref:YCII-related n=1 Tax=Maridesulfovibrio salexigens (strain ATCC 14822 / DSM 2638 / NCIMB 8403 / VKM B-1763) TaxID=526222 RepID=C6BXD7_MARSD|nr:YciI family protein [Maridesulfovibrio salexigens]ACS80443.1 YCII-related [Maridesulfovibrio salexigens DSM 2638]
MYILNLNYIKPLENIDALLEEHIKFLKKHYENGTFIASGRKVPRTGGIILARNIDLEQLEKTINEDPFKREGVAEYEIIEFIPTMMADGYEILKETPEY